MFSDWIQPAKRRSARPSRWARAAVSTLLLIGLATAAQSAEARYSERELRSVETPREQKIRSIQMAEIRQIRLALNRRLPRERRADLYFRMAEVYLELYRATFLLEGRVFEKRLAKKRKGTRKIDRGASRPYLRKGITAGENILKFGIRYDAMDRVYYFLAFNYAELGDRKKSQSFFNRLVSRYPRSPYSMDAYRELGDQAYRSKDFRTASQYYGLAVKRAGKSELLPELLHKQAWTEYRLKRFDSAVNTMKRGIRAASKRGQKFLNLEEEGLRDMAIFMVEKTRAEAALAYFRGVAGKKEYFPDVLERLGNQYKRNLKYRDSQVIFEALMKQYPSSSASFRVLVKLVDGDLKRKRYRQAAARVRNLRVPSGRDNETDLAYKKLKALVRRTATRQHEQYRSKGKRASLVLADRYYTIYLEELLSNEDSRNEKHEIQMYLAEVKRELGDGEAASDLYRTVLKSGDPKYSKQAAALWVASLSEAIRQNQGLQEKGQEEPSELEKEFIEAADEFSEELSNTNEAREASLRAAQIMAGYSDTQSESIERAKEIASQFPASSQALTAAKLWLQTLEDRLPDPKNSSTRTYRRRVRDIEEAVEELRGNKVLLSQDRRKNRSRLSKQMNTLQDRVRVGEIRVLERDGEFEDAGSAYLKIARSKKQRTLVTTAFTNALNAYANTGEAERAIDVFKEWQKRYPKSDQPGKVLRGVATRQLIEGRYESSAEFFRLIAENTRDAAALETAGRIMAGVGKEPEGRHLWGQYLKKFPRSRGRWRVALMMARSAEREQEWKLAEEAYVYCSKQSQDIGVECRARLGDFYTNRGRVADAKKQFLSATRVKRKQKNSPFLGYAFYRLALEKEKSTKLPELKLPNTVLQKNLASRLKSFELLNSAYLRAVDAGGPWAVASLVRLSQWTEKFALAIDAIDVSTASAALKKELAGISSPLKKQAIEILKRAYAIASDSEIYSPLVPEALDRLMELRVRGATLGQGFRGRFRLAGMPARGGQGGADKSFERVRRDLLKNPRDSQRWVDYGNLLWGAGKPRLSELAYERALTLNKKNVAGINNRGVLLMAVDGQEDWFRSLEAATLFRETLRRQPSFGAAQVNRAALLNYYRLFKKALPIWKRLRRRTSISDVQDGLGIALAGTGQYSKAAAAFRGGTAAGADEDRFAVKYHAALPFRASDKKECRDLLDDIDVGDLEGFVKDSYERLEGICQ